MSISNNALIFYHTYTIESKKKSVYFTDFSIKTSFSLEYRDRFERLLGYKRPENLSEKEHTKLAELSKLNTPLLKCYLMGDELRHLWSLGTRGQAIALVMDWIHRATHSRIKPLVDFGKNLRGYVQGIIAAADFKINTSVLEGVNNKIKQIKRRAYGFRDDLYFFLKVKAAFHRLPR